ncbi:MAG: tetratricopeptide repeat protein [Bryobacterales bacterium]|nr:tetratricopeptide repeat protein [Bryobacterales bacterium]
MYVRALAIRERALGPNHPHTAASLHNLADLYQSQAQFAKAEPLYLRALAIGSKSLGPDHPSTATSLNNLAELYRTQGWYAKAESPHVRALAIREKACGPDHPETATSLNNLALLYQSQGQYARSEPLFLRALAINEKALGLDHPNTATSLNNLALLYRNQEQYSRAELLHLRALAIHERTLGPDHPSTAASLTYLAEIYRAQEQYAKAEPLYLRGLTIHEKALGPDHPSTAASLNNLALIYQSQGQFAKAEPLYLRGLAIHERALGHDHAEMANYLNLLAILYHSQEQHAKAEPWYIRALKIAEKALGPYHPHTNLLRDNLAILYLEWSKPQQAQTVLSDGWPKRLDFFEKSMRFGRDSLRRTFVGNLQTQFSLLIALQRDNQAIREQGLQTLIASKTRNLEEFTGAIQAFRSRSEPDLQVKLAELDSVQDELAPLASPKNAAERQRKDDLLEKEDRLIAELTERSLEFRELIATPSTSQIRERLGNAALVEIVVYSELYAPVREGQRWGPSRYGAYVLTARGSIEWLDLGPVEAIDTAIRRFRFTIGSAPNRAVAKAAAQEIRRAVVDPIRKLIPAVTEWYVSPDGLLRLIPLAALPEDGSGQPVMATLQLHRLRQRGT